jgi:hypothetical protein
MILDGMRLENVNVYVQLIQAAERVDASGVVFGHGARP